MKKKGNLEFAAETSLAFSRYIFFVYKKIRMLEKKIQIYTSAIFSLFVIGYISLFSLSWSVTTSIAECTFLFLFIF